jgi:hypothetical protein
MKILHLTLFSLLIGTALPVIVQTESPKGPQNGTLVLADGSSLTGFIKDNIRKTASVQFSAADQGKKKNYNGTDLLSAEINGTKFICINGDFFKVFCEGELSFLQKASDASGKPVYNGMEAIFSSGTDGKLCYAGDFNGAKYLLENNLSQLGEELPPNKFFRVNRHLLVNIEAVSKVHTWPGGRLKLELELQPTAAVDTVVSRERVNGFKEWLGQ